MPVGSDLGGRAQVGFDARFFLSGFNRQRDHLRSQLDGLIGFRDREFKRRHGNRRDFEINLPPIRRSLNRRGQFEFEFVFSGRPKQQLVGAIAGAHEQHIAVLLRRQFPDRRRPEFDGHFDPRFAQHFDGQLRLNPEQRLIDPRRIMSLGDNGLDRLLVVGVVGRLPLLEVLGIGDEDGRTVLIEDLFEVLVGEIDELLPSSVISGPRNVRIRLRFLCESGLSTRRPECQNSGDAQSPESDRTQ